MRIALLTAASVWFLWSWLGTPPVAMGQPVLDRLEQRIRERLEPSAGQPSAAQTPERTARPGGNEHGWLGATVDDQNDRGRGVRVLEVRPGGPADKAGLRKNDLIVAAAGVRVRQMRDLSDVLELFPPGDTATLEVMRDSAQQRIKVTLGRRPASDAGIGEPAEVVPVPPAERTVPAERATPPAEPAPPREHTDRVPPPPQPPSTVDGPQLTPPQPGSRPAEPATLIEMLQRRIEQLERRIEALEKALAEKEKTEKR